jgi:hypothetical protein
MRLGYVAAQARPAINPSDPDHGAERSGAAKQDVVHRWPGWIAALIDRRFP